VSFWHDTWQWWLDVGFEGIAGGVIGGLVTGGAVWVTIRNDRRATQEAELRGALAELQALALRAGPNLLNSTSGEGEFAVMHDVFVAAVHARSRAMKPAPQLEQELGDFTSAWNDATPTEALPLARELGARMYAWLADPREAAVMMRPSWEGAAERSLAKLNVELGEDPDDDI
jgi:hypothetical protein